MSSSLLFSTLFFVVFILTDFVKGFIEPQGYGSFFNNRFLRQPIGMNNNFGFPLIPPAAMSSWNPYFNSPPGMLPSIGFNARASFGFGLPNFGGFGGGPFEIPPAFPSYPNNGYNGFGEFVPPNYGYGNQWPYYPNNNNNNNGFTQKPYSTFPTIPTLPSSAINNSNTFTTTTTPTVPITAFSK